MPKNKKLEESESGSSDSDSGPEDPTPAKKIKTDGSTSSRKDVNGEATWELERNRCIKVREFKGKVLIDIREYYDAGGELKPGKKGISLSAGQWEKLKGFVSEIDEAIKER